MKTLLAIISIFLFGVSCKHHNKQSPAQSDKYPSYHAEEEMADKAYLNFKGVLEKLYAIADTNPGKSITEANRLIPLYKDSIKLRGFSVSEINDLHYFKGEVFYLLGQYRQSIIEFTEYDTGAEEALASSYMQLKKFDSAFMVLSRNDSGTCLFDYEWGNYYEIVRNMDKATFHYTNLLQSTWIKSGAYENLKGKAMKRLSILKNKNGDFLNALDFPSHNPKNTSPYY